MLQFGVISENVHNLICLHLSRMASSGFFRFRINCESVLFLEGWGGFASVVHTPGNTMKQEK